MNLQGKLALVTGASRGIGKAISLDLAHEGAVVIGTSTSLNGAQHITDTLKKRGFKGIGIQLDVGNSESVEQGLKQVLTQFGIITILVNNAGITRDSLAIRMKESDWDQVINVNLNGLFRLSKRLLKGMTKSRWGRIINIGSVVGLMGNPGQVNYAASKAGLEGFSRSLALEVGSRSITVNAVTPGFIDTEMTRGLSESHYATLIKNIPLGRLGTPQDVANLVSFLSSEKANYITGSTIAVNGGMYMG